jgi:hypothetical protein
MSSITIIIIVAVVVILIVILGVGGVAIPLWSIRKNKMKAEALRSTGKPGEATIMQLQDTGVRVNENPRLSLLLEVRIPGYSPYQVRKTLTVPQIRLSKFQEGAIVEVLADPSQPTNPDKVGILLR